MRSLFVAVIAFMGVFAVASPVAAPQGAEVAAVGQCPTDCWNESAAQAGCDPNADDNCLCGPFFDAVTACVSSTCSIEENLEVLNTLEPACE